jgi:hypothetical protein
MMSMDKAGIPGVAVIKVDMDGVISQVTAELSTLAATVDGVSEAATPTMELLEASRAIQTALVLLNDWRSA